MTFDEIRGGRRKVLGKPLEFFIYKDFPMGVVAITLYDTIGDNFAMSQALFHNIFLILKLIILFTKWTSKLNIDN